MPRKKSIFQTIQCNVCGLLTDSRIRCGQLVCDACKKFYLRNYRQKGKFLRCITGLGNCSLTASIDNWRSKNGAALRGICASCRYNKCVAIGMRVLTDQRFNNEKHRDNCSKASSPDKYLAQSTMIDSACSSLFTYSTITPEISQTNLEAYEKALLQVVLLYKDHPSLSDATTAEHMLNLLRQAYGTHSLEARVQQLTAIVAELLGFPVSPLF